MPDGAANRRQRKSCTIGRNPTRSFCPASASMRATAVGCVEIRPADHAPHHLRLPAMSSRNRVSASVGAACTKIVPSIRAAERCGARSARSKVTIDRCQIGRQPTIVAASKGPQMMMRIDAHQSDTDNGTGASASSRRSAFRSAQSAAGTLLDSAATLRSTSCGLWPAQHDARDSRMAKGKMQRRSWQRNAMRITDAFDLFHLCQDLRWRIPIIVFGTTHRAGRQNT